MITEERRFCKEFVLPQEIHGASPDSEGIALFDSVEVQVNTVALDRAAAILSHSKAGDVLIWWTAADRRILIQRM